MSSDLVRMRIEGESPLYQIAKSLQKALIAALTFLKAAMISCSEPIAFAGSGKLW